MDDSIFGPPEPVPMRRAGFDDPDNPGRVLLGLDKKGRPVVMKDFRMSPRGVWRAIVPETLTSIGRKLLTDYSNLIAEQEAEAEAEPPDDGDDFIPF